jgi:hypothetical protein
VEPGGEIVVQDSGGYSTGFTITKGVTIDAGGFNASVISTGVTDLCTISAGASDRVVLRGITFHGASIGNNAINVTQVGSLYVEHCSITEFTGDAVSMPGGGNLFVTGTDVRKCSFGLQAGSNSATAFSLVGSDSRFTECANSGVELTTSASGVVTGSLINCIASLCSDGFVATALGSGGGSVDLTLTGCRAINNIAFGIFADTNGGSSSSTIRMANCVVTKNIIGITLSGPNAAVIGTSPGTNFISGNNSDGAPGSSVTLH